MEKQCKNVCVTDGEHKPLQQILPSKTVKWGGDCKGGGGICKGLNMVRLQCLHKALATPALWLSLPSVQWPLSGGFAVYLAGFDYTRENTGSGRRLESAFTDETRHEPIPLLALWTLLGLQRGEGVPQCSTVTKKGGWHTPE